MTISLMSVFLPFSAGEFPTLKLIFFLVGTILQLRECILCPGLLTANCKVGSVPSLPSISVSFFGWCALSLPLLSSQKIVYIEVKGRKEFHFRFSCFIDSVPLDSYFPDLLSVPGR
jgi:hypothetical protein